MSVGIRTTFNKFASLNIEDSDSDDHKKNPAKATAGQSKNAKKNARRRKKKESASVGKFPEPSIASLDDFTEPAPPTSLSSEWMQKDEATVEKMYQDDMWKAIELSKLEYEQDQNAKGVIKLSSNVVENKQENDNSNPLSSKKSDRDIRREKKRKEKALKTFSLEQFQQHVEQTLPMKSEPSPTEVKESPTKKTFKIGKLEGSGDFFDNIDKEVSRIHRREQCSSTSESVHLESIFLNERISEQMSQKDECIEELLGELESWKDKYHHVKKRNQQLLVMLQQGEMKDKAEILLDVERLSLIKDELTNEVAELHQSLERERSKVSKLKDDLKAATRQTRKTHDT